MDAYLVKGNRGQACLPAGRFLRREEEGRRGKAACPPRSRYTAPEAAHGNVHVRQGYELVDEQDD
ncbi:MAG: hypothetical protein A3D87_02880 [Omnitrophica WOR_2 bacterium RIFCSPHIGHO2_02_FULL_50_17]|nr:MAG: hypothetical protein A3D87_02880 [Omnitrophica WOR_2 bacterium RIFCSPHIGHO2_02_FULL_50_17]